MKLARLFAFLKRAEEEVAKAVVAGTIVLIVLIVLAFIQEVKR